MKTVLLALPMFLGTVVLYAQFPPCYNGSNSCMARIETSDRKYSFQSTSMFARFDYAQRRFEFIIPFSSITSQADTTGIAFVRRLCSGKDIIVYASIPDDKDPGLDLSPYRGNSTLNLAGQLKIGNFVFEDGVHFKGMILGCNQNEMAFNVGLSLNTREMPLGKVEGEQLVEIEFAGKGDKIIGLTSND